MPSDQSAMPTAVGVEIREGRPWWKVCCGGCFLFVAVALLLAMAAWRGVGTNGPRVVLTLPSNFPASVDVYRVEDAKSIEYLPGQDKDRIVTWLLRPFRWFAGVLVTAPSSFNSMMDSRATRLQQIDTVTIRWERLATTRDELYGFYLQELKRNGFAIDSRRDEATATDTVVARRNDVQVQLQVQDLPDIDGLDAVVLIVDYSNQ